MAGTEGQFLDFKNRELGYYENLKIFQIKRLCIYFAISRIDLAPSRRMTSERLLRIVGR